MTNTTKQFVITGKSPTQRAGQLVKAYAPKVSLGEPILSFVTASKVDVETCVVDILTDLRHLARAHGLDFDTMVGTSHRHFVSERAGAR